MRNPRHVETAFPILAQSLPNSDNHEDGVPCGAHDSVDIVMESLAIDESSLVDFQYLLREDRDIVLSEDLQKSFSRLQKLESASFNRLVDHCGTM